MRWSSGDEREATRLCPDCDERSSHATWDRPGLNVNRCPSLSEGKPPLERLPGIAAHTPSRIDLIILLAIPLLPEGHTYPR